VNDESTILSNRHQTLLYGQPLGTTANLHHMHKLQLEKVIQKEIVVFEMGFNIS